MDFQPQSAPPPPSASPPLRPARRNNNRSSVFALWIGLAILLAITLVISASQRGQIRSVQSDLKTAQAKLAAQQSSEFKAVDASRYQAVFLSSGQVYFGKIISMNPQYLKLTDIFYLQNNGGSALQSTSLAGNASLVKLGCELHAPYDQMIINLSRVDFWENLQDKGQVAQAIKKFDTGNPASQTCPA